MLENSTVSCDLAELDQLARSFTHACDSLFLFYVARRNPKVPARKFVFEYTKFWVLKSTTTNSLYRNLL